MIVVIVVGKTGRRGTERTEPGNQSITQNARCRLNASQVVFFVFLCIFWGKREKGKQKENNGSTRNTGQGVCNNKRK